MSYLLLVLVVLRIPLSAHFCVHRATTSQPQQREGGQGGDRDDGAGDLYPPQPTEREGEKVSHFSYNVTGFMSGDCKLVCSSGSNPRPEAHNPDMVPYILAIVFLCMLFIVCGLITAFCFQESVVRRIIQSALSDYDEETVSVFISTPQGVLEPDPVRGYSASPPPYDSVVRDQIPEAESQA